MRSRPSKGSQKRTLGKYLHAELSKADWLLREATLGIIPSANNLHLGGRVEVSKTYKGPVV